MSGGYPEDGKGDWFDVEGMTADGVRTTEHVRVTPSHAIRILFDGEEIPLERIVKIIKVSHGFYA